MHFDFTTLKGFKVAPNEKKKIERKESKKKKIREWRKKRLTCLLTFISCTLDFFNTVVSLIQTYISTECGWMTRKSPKMSVSNYCQSF